MIKRIPHNKIIWTDDEIEFIKTSYKTLSKPEIAQILGKTKRSIARIFIELNLKRSVEELKVLRGKINKKTGRDLSYDLVKEIAKKYNTRHEFYLKDSGAYGAAVKHKWLNDICVHMVNRNFSIPQLLLKDILEFIFDVKCSYNEKIVIKPLEIDCYFSKWNLGFEYDGVYYHNDNDDKIKKDVCIKNNIKLFNIIEKGCNYRNYEENIKSQIIDILPEINKIIGIEIDVSLIRDYKPKIIFPNTFTNDEKEMMLNCRLSQIRETDKNLFKKIKKYSNLNDLNNDIRYNKFKTIDEYKTFLLSKNYKNFTELCNKEHPYREVKKFGVDINEIKTLYLKK
jgi:hypothetical protein